MRINFGHNERNIRFHAPLAGIVDYNCAAFGKYRSELFANRRACGKECEVYLARAHVFFGEFYDFEFFAVEFYFSARASF